MFSKADDEGLLLEGEEVGEAQEEIGEKSLDNDEVVKKKMNPCEICDKSFSNRAALNKHKSKNHPSSQEKDEEDPDNSVVLDDPDDEDLLKENDDIIEIEEDIGENGSPDKSFDVVDIEELKKDRASDEKRTMSDDEDTPEKKRIKTSPEPQSNASNEDPIDYDLVISSSDYFTKNPKQITTKCNMGLHSKNIFTLSDPIMPNGWKMREHKKPDGSMEKHYLSPDGRVLKTRIAALEYLRIIKKYSKNEITAKGENKSKNKEDSIEVIKTVTPKANKSKNKEDSIEVIKTVTPKPNPVSYSNDMHVRRKKHNKTKKDPNAPKRPMASYFLFTVDERPKVNKEHPDWSVTQIAKELGQRWGLLEDSIKKKFQDQAEEARKQYDIDINEYRKTSSFSSFNDQKSVTSTRRPSTSTGQSARQFGVGQECPKCFKKVTSVRTHMEDVHDPPGQFPCPGCKKVYKSKNCMSSHYSRNCKIRA